MSGFELPDPTQTAGISYTYDAFDRLTSKTLSSMLTPDIRSQYTYATRTEGGTTYTSSLIASETLSTFSTTSVVYTYTYDALGNITAIAKNGTTVSRYEYDALNRLIREDDLVNGHAYVFTYDNAGNFTAKYASPWTEPPTSHLMSLAGTPDMVQTDSYTYSTSAWGDLLTNYNGTAISYDAIGNPLKWRNSDYLGWTGRRLDRINLPDNTYLYFEYNADGIRTKKYLTDADGILYSIDYLLDGTKIIGETSTDHDGATLAALYYYYDESGDVVGFEYNGTAYYYQKNIQGDVLRIVNAGGGIVAQYTYDAWGKVLSVTDANGNAVTSAAHVGNINPFRYRSYYYDTETGFYYLQSRYYDPVVGRFLNSDGIIGANGGITGYNLFAYCNDNPIGLIDPMGTCPHDGVLYTTGNFEGLPRYNPDCELCRAHGTYTLTGKDGTIHDFFNSTYEFELIEFIAGYETFSPTRNSNGTIGFGCKIIDNQESVYAVTGSYNPSEITLDQAYSLLLRTVRVHETILNRDQYMNDIYSMSINQQYAIISFSYNVGNPSSILEALRGSNDPYTVWINTKITYNGDICAGLIKRRKAEYQIYAYGIYDSTH